MVGGFGDCEGICRWQNDGVCEARDGGAARKSVALAHKGNHCARVAELGVSLGPGSMLSTEPMLVGIVSINSSPFKPLALGRLYKSDQVEPKSR